MGSSLRCDPPRGGPAARKVQRGPQLGGHQHAVVHLLRSLRRARQRHPHPHIPYADPGRTHAPRVRTTVRALPPRRSGPRAPPPGLNSGQVPGPGGPPPRRRASHPDLLRWAGDDREFAAWWLQRRHRFRPTTSTATTFASGSDDLDQARSNSIPRSQGCSISSRSSSSSSSKLRTTTKNSIPAARRARQLAARQANGSGQDH